MASIKKYKHTDTFSYTLGMAPTLDLLLCKPELVERIFISPSIDKNENTARLYKLCAQHKIVPEENDKAFNILSQKGNCFVIGMFRKYQPVLSEASHVLLVNPSDAGNLGNIIRTIVGFGIKNVGIIQPAVDIFEPKAVRATMGALFHVNFEYFNDIKTYLKRYHNHNLYAFMLGANNSLNEGKFKKPYSLIFGNEASGLPAEYSDFCKAIVIPHSAEIDSLNLTVAVAVATYAATANGKT